MAKIINVEKSQYITKNIETYAGNKIGQYSKYLDKSPIFVTWFSINEANTRSDTGSGGIHSEIGPRSPIRYNQINGLPVYNLPSELRPDVEFNEEGYDIELEISDAYVLPNTVKPTPGSYFIVSIPGAKELLFSVNSFSYNTIQSNDYYNFSAHLRKVGENLTDMIKPQVIDEFITIFENIGTDDKCFIRVKDIDMINDIGKTFSEIRDFYYYNFFDKITGCFVCKNNDIDKDNSWIYDKYLEKFIMESELFSDPFDSESVMLPCVSTSDLPSPELTVNYQRTLYHAILHQNTNFLASHPYYYHVSISRPLSPFVINDVNCKGVNLELINRELVNGHSDGLDSGMLHEYFSHILIQLIKGEISPTLTDKNITDTPMGEPLSNESIDDDVVENPESPEERDPITCLTYLEKLIYNYEIDHKPVIDRQELISHVMAIDPSTYRLIPIILYIIKRYYDSFFQKEEV